MKCPTHDEVMKCERTQYGPRYACVIEGCTVVCWNGKTSTPADAETRALRHRCHTAFDTLWKLGSRFKTRTEAYRWLCEVMGLPKSEAHIGMFDKTKCLKMLNLLGVEQEVKSA